MFRRILAATDFSETSWAAVREALNIAPADGEVGVCHVVPTPFGFTLTSPVSEPYADSPVLELETRARAELERRLEGIAARCPITWFVDYGEPYAEIIRRAEAFGADLVVVGSHGRTGLARILLGDVAERVVRFAHGPALVYRETQARGVVLAATDLSDPSLPAVSAGAAEARRRGARLVVLHVLDLALEAYTAAATGLFGATGAVPPPSIQEERREALLTTLRTALEREKVEGEPMIVAGSPAAAVVRTAEELGAELLVVGTRGRTGLSRVALGSTAERILRSAPCPTLAVRLTDAAV